MAARKILMSPLKRAFDSRFNPVYKRKLACYVASLCEEGSSILDVGCDDGSVARMMMEMEPSLRIVGIDIQSDRPSRIPRSMYDGRNIPYPDDSFDTVMALDVLHHTRDIPAVLEEIKRVSRNHIIIKDHMTYGLFSHCLVSLADYLSNAPYGIPCAFNFPTPKRWNSYFRRLGLRLVQRPRNLSFGFGINERYHPIFKLKV